MSHDMMTAYCTAVLCAAAPEVAPFMADEAVLEVPGLGKLEYNLKHYMKYARRVEEKKRTLNALGKVTKKQQQ